MMKGYITVVLTAALMLAAGCSKAGQQDRDKQAIHSALHKYLSTRSGLNLAGMDMEIRQVTTTGNQAQAQVEFRSKQGGVSMQMSYLLERQGDTWVVKGGIPMGPGGAHPPVGQDAGRPATPGVGELPASHPPLTPSAKAAAPTTPPAPAKKP